MSTPTYKHDGAVSFLKQDQPLALQIREALMPLDFFVYSKAQEAIAGQDGVGAFREVFRHNARVSMILFRSGWGKTPWTGVEELAIRDHCLNDGWDNLLFVRLEKGGVVPKWIPESYIYLDFEAYGLAELIGITKAKCASLGIEIRPQRTIDRARLLAEKERFATETKKLMEASPEPFLTAANALFDAIDEAFAEMAEGTGWELKTGRNEHGRYVARLGGLSLQLYAQKLYVNACAEAYLAMHVWEGAILTPQEEGRAYVTNPPKQIESARLSLTRTPQNGWCWSRGDAVQSTDEAAGYMLDRVISGR